MRTSVLAAGCVRGLSMADCGPVPPIITAGRSVCRLQLPRVRQAPNERCFPREQERAGFAPDPGVGTEGSQGAAGLEGAHGYATDPAETAVRELTWRPAQRQTVISQFYQLDRLVVEGGISVRDRQRANHGQQLTSGRAGRAATTARS